jgi:hypothetical protein
MRFFVVRNADPTQQPMVSLAIKADHNGDQVRRYEETRGNGDSNLRCEKETLSMTRTKASGALLGKPYMQCVCKRQGLLTEFHTQPAGDLVHHVFVDLGLWDAQTLWNLERMIAAFDDVKCCR